MKSLRLKLFINFFVSGLLCGFLLGFLFISGNCDSKQARSIPNAKTVNKNFTVIEKDYEKRIAVLKKQYGDLLEQLETTQSRLEQSKQAAKKKESSVKKIIESDRKKKEWSFANNSIPFFDTQPCECDSLKIEVISYINENHCKDSLYEAKMATMDSVVAVKDSIICANERLHNSLDSIFNQAITAQQILQTENHLLKKKEKHRKIKSRLITAGLLIMSSSVIHFFNH